MEKFIAIERYQACDILGGTITPEDRGARLLGRLVGAALRALYDLLTGKHRDPQAAGCW